MATGRPTGYLDLLELTMRYVEALEADRADAGLTDRWRSCVAGVDLRWSPTRSIATDRVDKTVAALLGGALVVVLGIVGQEEAFEAIDLNVIFLLDRDDDHGRHPAADRLLPVDGHPVGQGRRRRSVSGCCSC